MTAYGHDSDPKSVAYVALGSNLGNRAGYLLEALSYLDRTPGVSIAATSHAYHSPAMTADDHDQPDYLNAVARVVTDREPTDLLSVLLCVEESLGRVRRAASRWQPREIDLDLLLYDDIRMRGDRLTIPHPRLADRLFVLLPLAELIDPSSTIAPLGESLETLMKKCSDVNRPIKTIVKLANYR